MNITIKNDKVNIHSFNSSADTILQLSSISRDNNIINQLDIADGLKELLSSHGFTLEMLISMSSNDLAETLGIDTYVAMIIKEALHKKKNYVK